MVAIRLAEVVIANAVDENHQHRPGDKEERHRRKRVDLNTNLEEGIPVGSQGIEDCKNVPCQTLPLTSAWKKTTMLPSQESAAAPTAMLWLRAFDLLVNSTIRKNASSGGRGMKPDELFQSS